MDFEEVPFKSENTLSVWHNFLRSKCKNHARCKICLKVLKCAGGCTTGLQKHLKGVHKNISSNNSGSSTQNNCPTSACTSRAEEDTILIPKKKTKLTDFFDSTSRPTTEDTVSRMISLDGIPFRTFCTSEDLRRLFKNEGHHLPKSPNSIRNMVLEVTAKGKKALVEEIKKILSDGEKFSISFDEWTSNRNRRYLSLNLHSERLHGDFKFRNLGFLRIHGSMTAEKAIEELRNKLQSYGLLLQKDIVAITTDGCSLMSKIGRLLDSHHQKCLAHAVQLAVVDVFYKRIPIAVDINVIQGQESEDEDMTLADLARLLNENVGESIENSDREDDDDGVAFVTEAALQQIEQSEFRYHDILSKVRKTVKIFKNSPKKNEEYLQKYVLSEFGKEYQLILDVQTRWSSVANMLSRFLMLRDCITKALIDLKVDAEFTQEEWVLLSELLEVLDTMKIIVESLCQRDATLLTADVAMKFALETLDNLKSNLSTEMSTALKKRYQERRLLESSIMQYLANPNTYFFNIDNMSDEYLSIFRRPDGNEMHDRIVKLLHRTSSDCSADEEIHDCEVLTQPASVEAQGSQGQQLSKKDLLNLAIKKALSEPGSSNTTASNRDHHDLSTVVRVEIALWENGGERGRYLSLAYKHLSTIPPTSVEPERIFSSAGYICNRLRTRLSDQSLDAIIFLRTYYQQMKK